MHRNRTYQWFCSSQPWPCLPIIALEVLFQKIIDSGHSYPSLAMNGSSPALPKQSQDSLFSPIVNMIIIKLQSPFSAALDQRGNRCKAGGWVGEWGGGEVHHHS